MRSNSFKPPARAFRRRKRAFSLIELLCVIAIISLLAAMYFGVISRVFVRIKHLFGN